MAGKHLREDETIRSMAEPGQDDKDALLRDDNENISSPRTMSTTSEKTNDTLESTLLKLNDNMLSVSQLTSSMQQAVTRFAEGQRPSKRRRVNELSDSDTDPNNNASDHSKDDSNTLL